MPRIATARPPAEPVTDEQRARRAKILDAAARLGARHGLEHVQMADVAARAGVAVGTLYRYFPSKHHLFAGVLGEQVDRLRLSPTTRGPGAAEDVAALVAGAVRATLSRPQLARAMIIAVNVVRAEHDGVPPFRLDEIVLRVAALAEVTDEDRRLARLVEQCTYGVLTWATAGEVTPAQAEDDARRSALLLLADWHGRRRSPLAPREPT
jgi:AcrR family transcriptional regulator